jgi:hypothetical protein
MVATDQENEQLGLMQAIFSKMSDEEKAKLQGMGQAAARYDAGAMSDQMAPVHLGGGLLQMLSAPQMQYGQGLMGYAPNKGSEDKMAKLMKMMKVMGMAG